MRVLQSIIVVLAVLAVIGSAVEERESEDIQCPVLFESGVEKAGGYIEFKEVILKCIRPHMRPTIEERLQDANTTEEHREVVKGYCDKVSTYVECLASKKELSRKCLPNPIEAGKMNLQAKFIEHMLRVSCEQDGARLVPVVLEVFSRPESSQKRASLRTCFIRMVDNFDFNSSTINQFNIQQYQALKTFTSCVKMNVTGFEDSVALLNQVADTMFCAEQESGNEILCKNIAATSIVGPPVTRLETYSKEAVMCYMICKNDSGIAFHLKEAGSGEEYQPVGLLKEICHVKPCVRQCISNIKFLKELTGKDLDIFRGTMNLMEMVHDVLCEDEGVRLSKLLAVVKPTWGTANTFGSSSFASSVEGLERKLHEHKNYRLLEHHVVKSFTNFIADYGRDCSLGVVEPGTFVG